MLAKELPVDAIMVQDIQDRVCLIYDLGLPLHVADWYPTIYVTRGEGTYGSTRVKVYHSTGLDDLIGTMKEYNEADHYDRVSLWEVMADDAETETCKCDSCKELSQFC
jgi:hypothetical protein